jgi:hypothetical protein
MFWKHSVFHSSIAFLDRSKILRESISLKTSEGIIFMDVLDSMSVSIDFKGINSLNRFVSDLLVDKLMPVKFKTVSLCEDLTTSLQSSTEWNKKDLLMSRSCNVELFTPGNVVDL